jgi:hypothetical protein
MLLHSDKLIVFAQGHLDCAAKKMDIQLTASAGCHSLCCVTELPMQLSNDEVHVTRYHQLRQETQFSCTIHQISRAKQSGAE